MRRSKIVLDPMDADSDSDKEIGSSAYGTDELTVPVSSGLWLTQSDIS